MRRRVAGIGLAMCSVALASATSAGAAVFTIGPLPPAVPRASAQALSSPSGATLLYAHRGSDQVVYPVSSSGALGAGATLPADRYNGSDGAIGPVAFLPNGDAVLSFTPFASANVDLVVRHADGSFGPIYRTQAALVGFAVRSGEVLLVSAGTDSATSRTAVMASSLAIAADGTLSGAGAPAAIWVSPDSNTNIDNLDAVIDGNGRADVIAMVDHVSGAGKDVLDLSRVPGGSAWSQRSLSAGLPDAKTAGSGGGFFRAGGNDVVDPVATAPGGRAVLAFTTAHVTNAGATVGQAVYAAVRDPGGSFVGPSQVTSVSGADLSGAYAATVQEVRAAPDGTVGVVVFADSCQSAQASEARAHVLTAEVAPPGHGLAVVPVGGLASTTTELDQPTTFALGAGELLLGVRRITTTSGAAVNGCGYYDQTTKAGQVSDRVVVASATGGASAPPTVVEQLGAVGYSSPSSPPGDLAIYGGALDPTGADIVFGALSTPNSDQLGATGPFGATPGGSNSGSGSGGAGGTPGAGSPPPGDAPNAPPPPPGTGSAAPGGGSSSLSAGSPPLAAPRPRLDSVATRGLTATLAITCLGAPGAACRGTLVATVQEILRGASVIGVSARGRKAARTRRLTLVVGRVAYEIAAGRRGVVRLVLGAAGRGLLERRHLLRVRITATGTVATPSLAVTFRAVRRHRR